MKVKIDRNSPIGEILGYARKLNADSRNLRLSKNSRNATLTTLAALEKETGLSLRR